MRRVPPSEKKRQALEDWLAGKQSLAEGQPWLSQLIRLAVEKTLQELLEAEQREYLGRARYQRAEGEAVYRNGYEAGTLKTAEGVLRVEKPQLRGLEQPYRSQLWERFERSSEQLRQLVHRPVSYLYYSFASCGSASFAGVPLDIVGWPQ